MPDISLSFFFSLLKAIASIPQTSHTSCEYSTIPGIQLTVGKDKEANRENARNAIREAASKGAKIIALPVSSFPALPGACALTCATGVLELSLFYRRVRRVRRARATRALRRDARAGGATKQCLHHRRCGPNSCNSYRTAQYLIEEAQDPYRSAMGQSCTTLARSLTRRGRSWANTESFISSTSVSSPVSSSVSVSASFCVPVSMFVSVYLAVYLRIYRYSRKDNI